MGGEKSLFGRWLNSTCVTFVSISPPASAPTTTTTQHTQSQRVYIYLGRAPPPGKLGRDLRDKYNFQKTTSEVVMDKVELNIFKKDAEQRDLSGQPEVEIVEDSQGPKTGEQKTLEEELETLSSEDFMAQAMADPDRAMDPAVMAAMLPHLQKQLSEVLKEGISKDEV